MKIIHVVESFAGGVYDFLVSLTKGLHEYKHIIIHGKREDTPPLNKIKKDFPDETELIYWKNACREVNPKKDMLALFELLKVFKKYKDSADIIHLHSSKAGFLGRLAARMLGIENRVIYTSHGVSFLRKDIPNIKLKQFIFFEKLAYKLGGKVIACSKSEAEEFRKVGINAEYIYNGVPIVRNHCSSKKKPDKLIIGTVGRISYQKNPILFNKIAERFIQNGKVQFVWIGDGEFKHMLTSKNIFITGWLNRKEVLNRLADIDIYLSTSLWEGLPLSVLQAMALKKPLILSNCVGNRDLVENNINGFLCENLNCFEVNIKKLIQNKGLRKNFGENSYKIFSGNFSLERMIEKYKSLYKEVNIRSQPNI